MLAPVPTRPRSNPFRRRRGAAPLLVDKGAAAGKLPAESSTSVSSCFHSEVISTSSTSLAAFQRSEKRPRIQGDDEARPAGSECSEVIGGVTARPAEVEASESSCYGSMLESNLACPEKLTDQAEATEYFDLLTPLETEDEVLSAPYRSDDYVLSPLVDLYPPLTPHSDNCHDAAPSATFSIYHAFAKQFVPCLHPRARAATDPTSDLLPGKRFEDLDDEESYQRFRQRERRGVLAFDYTEAYSSLSGSNGRLVGEQRAVMVNWIIEHSNVMKLQPATMFMGIRLMDRFLTRGYIKGLRNLQLLGISCITLATRIEENRPYNCILLKTFKVGFNIYTRSEVVAMEWLVQEVLNFQCLVTTTHHFLWFYLKAAKANEKVEDLAKYLAPLSLMDHKQLSFWPSTVAAAVVALACLATNKESSCHLVMETHMRTKDDDLPECLMSLEWLITFASGYRSDDIDPTIC